MKTKIIAVLVACVLMMAGVAGAQNPLVGGFTTAEKASLEKLREGLKWTYILVDSQGCVTGNEESVKWLVSAGFNATQAAGDLMHVNIDPNENNGDAFLAGATRAEVVSAAWGELDRAIDELNLATAFVGQLNHTRALNALNAVDRTLTYATPYPATFPDQFGPHGDYYRAQRMIWNVIRYMGNMIESYENGLLAGELTSKNGACDGARAMRAAANVMFLSSHTPNESATEFKSYQNAFVQAQPNGDLKRALTEVAMVNGPVAQGNSSIGNLIKGVLLTLGTIDMGSRQSFLLTRIGDAWVNLEQWNGQFLKIETE